MVAIVTYSTGTATVGAGGTTVTGIGTIWSGVNARPGDIFQIGNFQTIISDVTDITHLVIPPWGGGAQTSQPYTIHQVSPQRFAGAQAMADVSTLVAALNTSGFFFFVGLTETVPDPSLGSDGQFAYQPTTGKTWAKTGGVWVLQTTTAGVSVGIRQAYSSTTTDADPGAGIFRLNHATPASATAAYLDNVDAGGVTVSAIWDTFDDSTNTVRGNIRFQKANDPTVWAQFNVTGSVVDGTGYRKLTLANGVSSGAFTAADMFAISFYRSGDAGVSGLLSANNLSDVANAQTARGNLGIIHPPQGRLTLATGVSVMTTSQTGKTTLYYTPYVGNQVPIYDGSKFVMTTFSELSIATTDTAKNPAAIGASKVNDWFVWNDSGTIRLSHGPDWTNDTTRSAGTNLARINGIIVNDIAITNGPGQYRGTYVGTTRSNGSSQLDWSVGGAASGGVLAILNVWNAYNRVDAIGRSQDSGGAYTFNGATRQARASASNQVNFVLGLQEDSVRVSYAGRGVLAAVTGAAQGWGYSVDTTATFDVAPFSAGNPQGTNVMVQGGGNSGQVSVGIGYHFIAAMEFSDGANLNTYNQTTNNCLSVSIRM